MNLLSHSRVRAVRPRTQRYRDAIATYIRWARIPHVCTLRFSTGQESKCGNTMVIYIPTVRYECMVITKHDLILHEYYITRGTKVRVQNVKKTERCSRASKKVISRSGQKEIWLGNGLLPLRSLHEECQVLH